MENVTSLKPLTLGQTVITSNALHQLNPEDVRIALGRHAGGDWGEVCAEDAKANDEALKKAGINSVFYVSPNTAHEFLSWRRSLHELAPVLFKD